MQPRPPPYDPQALDAFIALAGAHRWQARIEQIRRRAASGPRAGLAIRRHHAIELAIERLRGTLTRAPSTAELHAARLAGQAVAVSRGIGRAGRHRLRERLQAALAGEGTLVPLFHMLRTAALQASRGFAVVYSGLVDAAPYDLLIARGALEAEIACEVVSAEEGRLLHRGAWSHLADRLDADLRAWLTDSPGRYLLKMTLPLGLRNDALAEMHDRIRRLLQTRGRRDDGPAAVLRLDPLAPTAAGALIQSLRREFGPEAHLAVTAADGSVFAMAARSGRTDQVAIAMRRRLFDIAPTRLAGIRPGILAMFIDDTDPAEWLGLRERLELEGEARQFLACQAARPVVAVTCTSRCELLGMADAADEGELRFRNSAHPAAKASALGPAILSSV